MRGTQHVWILAGLLTHTAGCVAPVKEARLYGPPRPRFDEPPDVVAEREPGDATVQASVRGTILDVSVLGTSQCRRVAVTSRVRDVSLRRSFANSAQETNGAVAMLLGAAAGVLQYSADQISCPSGSACWSTMISAEYATLALAAIPIGFAVYNALRVRDGSTTEPALPEIREGAWRTCATEPLAGEPIAVSIGSVEFARTTDLSGHASVDIASLLEAAGPGEQSHALVRHRGSRDINVDFSERPGLP